MRSSAPTTRCIANFDRIPQGASQPLIKARSIDDVPVLAMTFWGKNYDGYALRRIAAEVQQSVKQVENVSETTLLGGQRRELRIMLDPQKLAALPPGPTSHRASALRRAISACRPDRLPNGIRNSWWKRECFCTAQRKRERSSWRFRMAGLYISVMSPMYR